MAAHLAEERATFLRHRESLLQDHPDQHVLISGSDVVAVFDDANAAFEEGMRRFGIRRPFLIEPITSTTTGVTAPALVLGLIDAKLP